jgi:hypothetical protein
MEVKIVTIYSYGITSLAKKYLYLVIARSEARKQSRKMFSNTMNYCLYGGVIKNCGLCTLGIFTPGLLRTTRWRSPARNDGSVIK